MIPNNFVRTTVIGLSSLVLVACGSSDSNSTGELAAPLDDVTPTADADTPPINVPPPVADDAAAPPVVVVPPSVPTVPDTPAPPVATPPSTTPGDSDGDGIADELDVDQTGGLDTNSDGIDDAFQNLPPPALTPPPVVTPPPTTPGDVDADGIADDQDVDQTGGLDTNSDGIDDAFQNLPPTQPDNDADADGDTDTAVTPPPDISLPTGTPGTTIIPATHGTIASVDFDFDDPFGADLERNIPQPQGAIPTAPGRLRLNLLSNDWIEIDWTPSADDGEVVEYRIYRDDEQIYTVRGDQTHPSSGSRNEIDKFWQTTSFIDCNFTRFGGVDDPLHRCVDNAPVPGVEYTWFVTAVDNDGNESAPSNTLTARLYDNAGGSPVALYSDIFLDGDDIFPFATDFSRSENFLDQFALVFSDDFNDQELDLNNWNTELVWTSNVIINGEQQFFVNSSDPDNEIDYDPFRFTGDSLVIEGIPLRPGDEELLPEACFVDQSPLPPRCQFLSGAIASHDKFGFTYGYVEGRMRVSDNTGGLSSFYLFHRFSGTGNGFHSPEIDIVEYLGDNPFGDEDAFQTYHYSDPVTGLTKSSPTMNYENPTGALFSDDFHTYSVLWEPGLSIWYVDGVEIRRISGPQIGRQQMNIVAYLVTGSEWAPTPTDNFPLQMEIDFIRAYQRPAYICNNSSTLAAFGNDMAACQAQLNP